MTCPHPFAKPVWDFKRDAAELKLLQVIENALDWPRAVFVGVLPARPGRPRDKAKIEVDVQVVERWIRARLHQPRLFHLNELNGAIAELLTDVNQRSFKKLPGCHRSAFEKLDAVTTATAILRG